MGWQESLSAHDVHMVESISTYEHEVTAYMSTGVKLIRNVIIMDGDLIREEIRALKDYSPATTG